MGDGVLAEFRSVVDATRCAIEWQVTKAQKAAEGDSSPLVFRIGINLGDIISEPPDIHGDGVNLADRVQALARPGGIALSGSAYEQVHSKVAANFTFIGAKKVKSIPDPIRVYQINLGADGRRRSLSWARTAIVVFAAASVMLLLVGSLAWYGQMAPRALLKQGDASLVILPFDNLSDDGGQGHLADGITEDLTTELARVQGLFVISRSAAFGYRSAAPQKAAHDLGVRYVLEGSVRRAGDELRVTAQLVDAESNGHVWANRYDGAWADVFAVQDKIVVEITKSLELKLAAIKRGALMAGGTRDPLAYEAYLQGRALLRSDRPDDWRAALAAYQRALSLDDQFGAAAAEIAWLYHDATGTRLSALGTTGGLAREEEDAYARIAERNPSAAYYQLLSDQLVGAQKLDDAIKAAQIAIDLDPSDPLSMHAMAYALILNG
ncbi:adenylate/guanylate cyclase domain-containing protein, partial [Rhizobium sp. CF142]|uniref:adenylate/guanylate cyclase domain-containing protein n=1 Tax=Rhizobium sp. CF142 TaxID=1144314 RepID=UPI00244E1A31